MMYALALPRGAGRDEMFTHNMLGSRSLNWHRQYERQAGAGAVLDNLALRDAIRRLPPRPARAWSLVNLCGLTHREAAARLGISQQRVSVLNESARRALEKELSNVER
jgi:RNA polymerase sigma factor (sigma-70 family)